MATPSRRPPKNQPGLFDRSSAPVYAGGPLRTAGLFAGIGGVEHGLHLAGHGTQLLCEIDEGARAVLAARFPRCRLHDDIRTLTELPEVDLVAAGFPCQDLSQAGQTAGIGGERSGLVSEVFRLLRRADHVRWLLLENVPFMLRLARGQAMAYLRRSLEELGFRWAYRTVDTLAFGLPQRRQRVLLLASRTHDPRTVLYPDDVGEPDSTDDGRGACGFYWTEGLRGLGWAVDAVPTLKGGSTIGIPSPPAIWMRHADGAIVTPDIRDAERLQGFDPDWTLPATAGRMTRKGVRWKLVGNAVSVPVARWIGERLITPGTYRDSNDLPHGGAGPWPPAAYGMDGQVFEATVSMRPRAIVSPRLADFLRFPVVPLSERGARGFLGRASRSCLRFPPGLLDALRAHVEARRRSA